MLSFQAEPAVLLVLAIWLPWRIVVWRRHAPDAVREIVVLALLAYLLALLAVTMFPLQIVLYDWSARFSLVPFVSTLQLLQDTPPTVALRNVGGNLVLLLPLGVLLPLLFDRLRGFGPTMARVVVVSLGIETVQLLSRARAVDVDDILFNSVGGAVGFAIFRLVHHALERHARGRRLLDRVGSDDPREPLLRAALPIGVAGVVGVGVVLVGVVGATVGDGPAGIEAEALEDWSRGRVVARADLGREAFLLVSDGNDRGERLRLVAYNEVLPGRFARETWTDPTTVAAADTHWGITPYNVAKGQFPTVYAWGRGPSASTAGLDVRLSGNGVDERFPLAADGYFVVAAHFDPGDLRDVLPPFTVDFAPAVSGRERQAQSASAAVQP